MKTTGLAIGLRNDAIVRKCVKTLTCFPLLPHEKIVETIDLLLQYTNELPATSSLTCVSLILCWHFYCKVLYELFVNFLRCMPISVSCLCTQNHMQFHYTPFPVHLGYNLQALSVIIMQINVN